MLMVNRYFVLNLGISILGIVFLRLAIYNVFGGHLNNMWAEESV